MHRDQVVDEGGEPLIHGSGGAGERIQQSTTTDFEPFDAATIESAVAVGVPPSQHDPEAHHEHTVLQ